MTASYTCWLNAAARGRLLGLLLGLAGLPAQGQGQAPPVLSLPRLQVVRDSLTHLLARDPQPDTLRVMRLNTLAFILRTNEAASAQRLARQGLTLAQRLHYERGLVEAHFNLGYLYRARSQYDSAIFHSQRAMAWALRTHNRYTQTRAYYNLARIYTEQGNYAAALGPSLDGLALAHTMHNSKVEVLQLVQAGRIELGLGEYATARAYVEQARRLLPAARDTGCTGFVYLGFGDISRQQGQWLAARRAYTRTLGAYQTIYKEPGLLPVQLDIAEMTERLGDYSAARRVGQVLLRRARTVGSPEQVAKAALLLARTWLPTRPDSARRYAALSLATAQPHSLRPIARDAALILALTSDQLGQDRRAYRYQVLATAYADTLSGEDTRRRLAMVQARAARSRTQAELSLLQQQVRLRSQQQELARLRTQRQLAGLLGVAGLLTVLAGGSFWQYRRRQQAQRARAATALRTRLAADLHDDVGHLLTQLAMQSNVLRETAALPLPQQARLDTLAGTARYAVQQMTDVVWSLQDEVMTLPQLLDRMRDHAHQTLSPAGLDVDFRVSAGLPTQPLTAELRHNLYLIYKEAIHNVVKHAHATLVTVTIAAVPTNLTLTIADNGQGHDGTPRPGGNGLRNMQARAQTIGGTVRYEARPTGFAVVAQVPL